MMEPSSPILTATFDENDPKYKCCCGSCHIKVPKGANVVGIIWACIVALYFLTAFVGSFSTGGVNDGIFIAIIWTAVIAVMFYGLHSERAVMLIPMLGLHGLCLLFLIVASIAVVVILCAGGGILITLINLESNNKVDKPTLTWSVALFGVLVVGVFLVIAAVDIFCFTVMLRCALYLRDKRKYFATAVVVPMSGYGPTEDYYAQQQQQLPFSYGAAEVYPKL